MSEVVAFHETENRVYLQGDFKAHQLRHFTSILDKQEQEADLLFEDTLIKHNLAVRYLDREYMKVAKGMRFKEIAYRNKRTALAQLLNWLAEEPRVDKITINQS